MIPILITELYTSTSTVSLSIKASKRVLLSDDDAAVVDQEDWSLTYLNALLFTGGEGQEGQQGGQRG